MSASGRNRWLVEVELQYLLLTRPDVHRVPEFTIEGPRQVNWWRMGDSVFACAVGTFYENSGNEFPEELAV